MALAILKYLDARDGQHVFEADIGTNLYYQYTIGKERRKYRGLELVDEVVHQSPLMKAPVREPTSFQTHFPLRIPANLFNRDSRFVQITSFKTQSRHASAISEIETIVPVLRDSNDEFKLPKIMTLSETHEHSEVKTQKANCHIKENKVSEAMFFQAVLGALPGLLANAGPALRNALPVVEQIMGSAGPIVPEISQMIPATPNGNGSTSSNGSSAAPAQPAEQVAPEMLNAILEVIQTITAQNGNSNGQATAQNVRKFSHDFSINPQTLMQLAPLLEKVLSPETIKAIGDNPVRLFKAISDSALKFQKMELDHLENINPGVDDSGFDKAVQELGIRRANGGKPYSQAKVAPALLAALPALMPVLEKVLSPDMIKAIGEQPVKLFNAIADAGLKHTKQELDHLERINPGVDDPAFDNIVNSMSVKSAVSIDAVFSDHYAIEFINAQTISVAGKEKVVYDRREKAHFPVKITSGSSSATRRISKAIFQLIIQDGDTMDVLMEKKFKLKEVAVDQPIHEIILESDELKKLPVNRDLKLEVSFNWRTSNKVKGTFKNHYVSFCDGYVYQRPGSNLTQHFALNDVLKFRKYWHKVWEGGPTTHERWKIDFECKYYYMLNTDSTSIRRMATKKKTMTDSATEAEADDYRRRITAKLKTGMEISLAAYNELLRQLQLTPLSSDQLSAFTGQDFRKEASAAARVSVDFRGRKGETAALWIYPEGNIQAYVLSKATQTDPTGMISGIADEEVQFPKFSSVHFIGTKST